jgi:hypothetical protein
MALKKTGVPEGRSEQLKVGTRLCGERYDIGLSMRQVSDGLMKSPG